MLVLEFYAFDGYTLAGYDTNENGDDRSSQENYENYEHQFRTRASQYAESLPVLR